MHAIKIRAILERYHAEKICNYINLKFIFQILK